LAYVYLLAIVEETLKSLVQCSYFQPEVGCAAVTQERLPSADFRGVIPEKSLVCSAIGLDYVQTPDLATSRNMVSNGVIMPLDESFLKKQLSQPFFATASGPSLS
jgi:hypothetical protein